MLYPSIFARTIVAHFDRVHALLRPTLASPDLPIAHVSVPCSHCSFLERLEKAVADVGPSADLRAGLASITRTYVDFARQSPDLVRFIDAIAFSGLYEEQYNFVEFTERLFSLFDRILERARRAGEVRDDLEIRAVSANFCGMLWMATNGIVYAPDGMMGGLVEENIVEILLKGIAARGA